MASILQSATLLKHSSISSTPTKHSHSVLATGHSCCYPLSYGFSALNLSSQAPLMSRVRAVAQETIITSASEGEAARRVYIGNIPRNITNDELRRIVQEHGAPEIVEVMYDKYSGRSRRFGFATMKTVEDANAVVDKLDGTEVGGRKIKVNVTEKPLEAASLSVPQADEAQFVDSGHKIYVGNLAKTVTSDILKDFFSEKGGVVSAKVQRDPGTSKSTGYGFVSFSSEEEAEAAISALNNAVLEGQKIRVNKA